MPSTRDHQVVELLLDHSHTAIQRHIKVQGQRSVFDADWIYWSTRMGRDILKSISALLACRNDNKENVPSANCSLRTKIYWKSTISSRALKAERMKSTVSSSSITLVTM